LSSAKIVLEKLTTILSTPFDSEEEFDQSLFTAFTECLQQEVHQHQVLDNNTMDDHCFLFKRPKNPKVNLPVGVEYAVGLARQTAVARDLYHRITTDAETIAPLLSEHHSASSSICTMSNNDSISPYDHAVCLFEKDVKGMNNTWTVKDCFAVVELKTSDSTCTDGFDLDLNVRQKGHICEPYLDQKRYKALGQALLYTLEGVLPFHARRGILHKSLPVVILAGIKKDKPKPLKILANKENTTKKEVDEDDNCEPPSVAANEPDAKKPRWLRSVSASLEIPEACGDLVTYSVHDFVKFYDDPMKEMTSMERALVLYIDTITFGLKSAFAVLRAIENGDMPPPQPASGQCLMIGSENNKLDCQLCASPIHGANGIVTKGPKWKVSQGELFAGTLNVHAIDFDGSFVTFFDDALINESAVKVIVKVSSVAVHSWLVDPSDSFSALKTIGLEIRSSLAMLHLFCLQEEMHRMKKQAFQQEASPSEEMKWMKARAKLQTEIGSVLYAAVETNAGMLTIMSDLSAQGYTTLSAAAGPNVNLSVLWEGFSNLVTNVLLPLASMGIVHADIRPGFDETSNILCKFDEEGASLKLIDYESLVKISTFVAPRKGNYIKLVPNWTATTFVWWQCLAVAYAWKEKVPAKTFSDDKGENALVVRLMNDFCFESEIRGNNKEGRKPLLPANFVGYAYANRSPRRLSPIRFENLQIISKTSDRVAAFHF
jgi:hypothetical protein